MLRRVSVPFLVAAAVLPGCPLVRALPAPSTPPAVTTVLPSNTPGLVLINTTPTAWAAANRFNPLPGFLKAPPQVPLLPATINFSQDIQPWLGDYVALALVPTAGSIEGSVLQSLDASAVLLAPIQDRDRFTAFLNKLKATRGQPEIEREYKGVTILQWTAPAKAKPAAPIAPGSTQRLPPRRPVPETLSQSLSGIEPISPQKTVNAAPGPKRGRSTPVVPTVPVPAVPTDGLKPRGLAIALLHGTVAIAAQAHTLEDLIDAQTERTPLTQNPLFQRTLQHPQMAQSLVVSYGDVEALAKVLVAIAKALPQSPLPIFPLGNETQIAGLAKRYNTVDSHVWVQAEGIHSQVNVYYTTPQPDRATTLTPDANQILTRLPAGTYLSANSRNFKRQWQSAIAGAADDLPSQLALASFRNSIRTATGLDPEKDVFPWMDGEYALFFFPTTGGLFNTIYSKLNLGVGLMVQTSDRPAAEAALKKLDQFVKKSAKGDVAIVPRRLHGQPIVSWEGNDKGKVIGLLSHAWLDNKTLIITTGAEPMAALNPKPYLPLDRNYTFQTATASFPIPNEGYFYVNMGASLSFLYNLILPSVPKTYSPIVEEAQRVIGSIRSISTSNSTTADAERVDTLWVLSPVQKPSPVTQAK